MSSNPIQRTQVERTIGGKLLSIETGHLAKQASGSVVVRIGRRLVGYLCLWEIGHEIHITNLAVRPEFRRRGIARALLSHVMEGARQSGVELVFLEVRPTNLEALALYESFGFRVIGRRKGYYFDTGEDALVMEARLDECEQPTSGNRTAC